MIHTAHDVAQLSFVYSLPPNTKLYGFKGTTNAYLASLAFIYWP